MGGIGRCDLNVWVGRNLHIVTRSHIRCGVACRGHGRDADDGSLSKLRGLNRDIAGKYIGTSTDRDFQVVAEGALVAGSKGTKVPLSCVIVEFIDIFVLDG